MNNYWLCGLRVVCEFPLPELWRWKRENQPPDIEIKYGFAPELKNCVWSDRFLQINSAGECRVDIPKIATFFLSNYREVLVQPYTTNSLEIRQFLLGTIFGILCHQRGLFPLHAACIRTENGAIAISGVCGTGKSTVATALMLRNRATILADDVCVLEPSSPGPCVLPSFPRLKLKPEAVNALGISLGTNPPVLDVTNKYHFPLAEDAPLPSSPVPLHSIVFLEDQARELPKQMERVKGFSAVNLLLKNVYRIPIACHLGQEAPLFKKASLIAQEIPVYRLVRQKETTDLLSTVSLLENLFKTPLSCSGTEYSDQCSQKTVNPKTFSNPIFSPFSHQGTPTLQSSNLRLSSPHTSQPAIMEIFEPGHHD